MIGTQVQHSLLYVLHLLRVERNDLVQVYASINDSRRTDNHMILEFYSIHAKSACGVLNRSLRDGLLWLSCSALSLFRWPNSLKPLLYAVQGVPFSTGYFVYYHWPFSVRVFRGDALDNRLSVAAESVHYGWCSGVFCIPLSHLVFRWSVGGLVQLFSLNLYDSSVHGMPYGRQDLCVA